jgi:hypothetical protein
MSCFSVLTLLSILDYTSHLDRFFYIQNFFLNSELLSCDFCLLSLSRFLCKLQNNLIKPFGFFVFPSTPLESKLSLGLLATRVIPRGELQSYLIKPFGFFVFPSTPFESKLSLGLLATRVIPRGELRMKNLQFASYEGLLASRVIPRGELQSYLIKPFGFFVFPSTPLESKLSLVFR